MGSKDIFILVPVTGKYTRNNPVASTNDMKKYIDILEKTSQYECDLSISNSIKRYALEEIEIAYLDDEYDIDRAKWIPIQILITYQEQTKLGVVQLLIPQCNKVATQFGEMVSSHHLIVRKNEDIIFLRDYLLKDYNLHICGKLRTVYCMASKEIDVTEVQYMLAGETIASEHADYKIKNVDVKAMAEKDVSSYDFYNLYASQNAVVYCTKNFGDDFCKNMHQEALLLYICEIAVLQNSAISRINKNIVDELMENSDISARKTLKLQVEFGNTILLWDNNIYNYYMAQRLSDKIIEAFGTKKLFDEYCKNKEHIDQIAALKNGISSDVEGKILNILAFVLSVSELIKLINSAKNYILGIPIQYGILGGTTLSVIIILLAIIRNRKR